jgi:hypothetical protein
LRGRRPSAATTFATAAAIRREHSLGAKVARDFIKRFATRAIVTVGTATMILIIGAGPAAEQGHTITGEGSTRDGNVRAARQQLEGQSAPAAQSRLELWWY